MGGSFFLGTICTTIRQPKTFTEVLIMSARKIFAAILLAVMAASGSFADVTPKQVLRDPRFYPHVEATREKGADFLPGRYV